MSDSSGCFTKIAKFIGYFVISVFAIGVFVVILDNDDSSTSSTDAQTQSEAAPETETSPKAEADPDLEVLSHDAERGEYGNPKIVGVVKNNTGSSYSYVQVEINIYEQGGDSAQLGSTVANTNNLEAGGKWKFEAAVLEDVPNGFRYEIKDVTGY